MTTKVTNFIKQHFFTLALAATFVGFSAFKFSQPERQNLFWYDLQGNPISDGAQPEPDGACALAGEGCAVGYFDEPADPTDGEHDETRGLTF